MLAPVIPNRALSPALLPGDDDIIDALRNNDFDNRLQVKNYYL